MDESSRDGRGTTAPSPEFPGVDAQELRQSSLNTGASYFGIPVQDLDALRQTLRTAISSGKKFAVVGHVNVDPDAAGAMEGSARLLEIIAADINGPGRPGVTVDIKLFAGGRTDSKIAASGFRSSPIEELIELKRELGDDLFIIQVDAPATNIPHVAGKVPTELMPQPDVVLDHHGGATNGKETFIYTDSRQVGAASTITMAAVHRELAGQRRDIPDSPEMRRTIDLWAAGVHTDSRADLPKLQAQSPTSQAAEYLDRHADPAFVETFDIAASPGFGELFRRGLRNMQVDKSTPYNVGYCYLGDLSTFPDARAAIAVAAEDYLDFRPASDRENGLDAVFVLAHANKYVLASARSNGTFDAAAAAQAIFGSKFGGGKEGAGGAQMSLEGVARLIASTSEDPDTVVEQGLPKLADRVAKPRGD